MRYSYGMGGFSKSSQYYLTAARCMVFFMDLTCISVKFDAERSISGLYTTVAGRFPYSILAQAIDFESVTDAVI